MKTLTQLSKEELEAFEKRFYPHIECPYGDCPKVKYLECVIHGDKIADWLLAHDRRIIEAAFAATMEKNENVASILLAKEDMASHTMEKAAWETARKVINVLKDEVNNLKQQFLS